MASAQQWTEYFEKMTKSELKSWIRKTERILKLADNKVTDEFQLVYLEVAKNIGIKVLGAKK